MSLPYNFVRLCAVYVCNVCSYCYVCGKCILIRDMFKVTLSLYVMQIL